MGKGSAMKCYCTIQLPHARPTMHCIPLVELMNGNDDVISASANHFAYRPDTPIDLLAGQPYRASARSMDLLVSLHS